MELENETTNYSIKILYGECEYFMTGQMARQIGFINGMIESGLYDDLALPLHIEPLIAGLGHKVLEYISSNPVSGMDYLQAWVLGATSKEYIEQIDKLNVSEIRNVLEQVFALLALADYWDCPEITSGCSEFIALVLSKADQHTVREWFSGIV